MQRRTGLIVFVIGWLVAALGLGALNYLTPRAEAGDAAPPAAVAPPQDATGWTVGETTFESNYPDGFTFSVTASSEGGAIERARLIWHRTELRESEIVRINAEDAEYDPDTGRFTATWEPSGTEMLPPWVLLNYHWEFRDAASNVYETGPGLAEYADHTREWTRSESEDVIVLSSDLPTEIEDMVLDAMAIQHDQYVAVWGRTLPYKPRIVLFGDYDAWLEWRTADHSTSDTAVIVGQTFEAWGMIVQVLYGPQGEAAYRDLAYSTVVHEVEHLYQAEFLARRRTADIPGWFIEGDASFFELQQSYDYLGRVRNEFARNGTLPPLLVGVADAPRVNGPNPRDGYDIGYSFFVWMEQLRGDLSTHREVMALLAADVPFFTALEQATGMPKTEIERNWRTWLGAAAEAPTLVPTWTPVFPTFE